MRDIVVEKSLNFAPFQPDLFSDPMTEQAYINELRSVLGDKVLTHDFQRYIYGADWSPRTKHEIYFPDCVIVPRSTDDIMQIVQIAYEYGTPITVGGGLTGMLGSAVPIHGGIFIDSTSMNRIIEIDENNQTIGVQAGATLQEINDALEPYGLWYPVLPESKWSCTIGSEICNDTDSTFGHRYGKVVNYLLSLKVVTGHGEAIEFGNRKTHFSSSGYRMKDLFIGSEGTLGVITEVTLKAVPKPEDRTVDMVIFPSLSSAVDFLSDMLRDGISIEGAHINCKRRLKFYTHAYYTTHGHHPDIPDWAAGLLAFTLSGNIDVVAFNRQYILERLEDYEAQLVQEHDIVDGWWVSKHTLEFPPFKQKWPDAQREKKFGAADPGVPMGMLESFYEKFIEIAHKYDLEILGMNAYLEQPASIGFSLSCAVFVNYRDQDEVNRFRDYHRELTRIAVDMEGTSSTYMGDSDVKIPNFQHEHGPAAEYYRALKFLLDPKNIMNPGKKFPRDHPSESKHHTRLMEHLHEMMTHPEGDN